MATYKKIKASQLSIDPTGVYISQELYCEKEEEFWEDVSNGKIIIEGDVQDHPVQVNTTAPSEAILLNEYPIKDEAWPSRRWNKERTDYIDLSGGEHPVKWIAWGETITITNHNDINVVVNPSGNHNAGIPSPEDRRQAEELVRRFNAFPDMLEALQSVKKQIMALEQDENINEEQRKALNEMFHEVREAILSATNK